MAAVLDAPVGHHVDGHLEQAHGRAQCAGDEVQLVLDDQVRGPKPGGGVHGGSRMAVLARVLAAVLDLAVRVVRVHQLMALAVPRDVAEQGCRFAFPREAGELVDGGDDERRGEPVDLLIHGQDRQTLLDLTTVGERALGQLVTAVHVHPALHRVCLQVPGLDAGTAPRATLDLQHRQPVSAALVGLAQLLSSLVVPLRAHIGSDPQPDPKRHVPPRRGVLHPRPLRRADQRGGTLELLGGQQPQRVAHEHRHTGAAVQRTIESVHHTLSAPDRERVRGQTQVCLGLATAGREEQQLRLGQIAGALLGGRVGQQRELHQDERELEGVPGVSARSLVQDGGVGLVEAFPVVLRLVRAPLCHLRLDALISNHPVHEPEAAQCLLVGQQMVQALRELPLDLARLGDRVEALRTKVLGQRLGPLLLAIQPGRVRLDDGRKAGAQFLGSGLLQPAHVEQGRTDLLRSGLRRLAGRQPGRPHLAGPASTLGHLPVHRAGAPNRELQPVAVLQPQPAQLVVRFVAGVRQRVVHRQEHRLAAGRGDDQFGLVEPCLHWDLARCLPIVAERDLDQTAAALGVVVAVHSQHDLVLQHVRLCPRGGEIGDRDRGGDLVRRALVAAETRGRLLALAVLVLNRLVGAPGRGDRERVQVIGDLAAQTHRRRDHQTALLWLVLDLVLVRAGAALIHSGHGYTAALGRIDGVTDIGRGVTGTRLSGVVQTVCQPDRGDPADQVCRVRDTFEDLLGAARRSEKFTLQDVGQVLARCPGPVVRFERKTVALLLLRGSRLLCGSGGHSSSPSSSPLSSPGGTTSPCTAARR